MVVKLSPVVTELAGVAKRKVNLQIDSRKASKCFTLRLAGSKIAHWQGVKQQTGREENSTLAGTKITDWQGLK